MKLKKLLGPMLVGTLAFSTLSAAYAANDIRVTYAGSMGVVMDKDIGPTFAAKQGVNYQGQGQGAYGMARLLASRKLVADVFISINKGPMDILQKEGLVDYAVPVASTRMVIAYNPKGKYAEAFQQASKENAQTPWWKVLQTPGLRFGRTDPTTDPQGRNIIFSLLLAQRYYHQPDLAHIVLGDTMNPKQVFSEGGLLSRLEAGQIDASSGYESAVRSSNLPYITLPDEINLSNPRYAKDWYDTASFDVTDSKGKQQTLRPEPLVFYAAVLKNAPHPEDAKRFVEFLQSSEGQALFKKDGYDVPKGDALYK